MGRCLSYLPAPIIGTLDLNHPVKTIRILIIRTASQSCLIWPLELLSYHKSCMDYIKKFQTNSAD